MTHSAKTEALPLDAMVAEHLARLCAGYAAAWEEALVRGAELPRPDGYLARVAEADRRTLQGELEAIDRAYRQRQGEATIVSVVGTKVDTASEAAGAGMPPAPAGTGATLPSAVEALDEVVACSGPVGPAAAPHRQAGPAEGDLTTEHVPRPWLEPTIAARDDRSFSLSADVAVTSRPGQIPVQGYEIVGELGRGGMGVVYKARQLGLNRWAALKMVLAGAHAGQHELARFRTEAEAVARLQHPNIVQIYEINETDGLPYFSLEFVDGGCLVDKIHRRPQPPREAAHLTETLARAMQYAHERGIVHRDLKPGNVLLTADGMPKITDFGLAKRLEGDSSQTRSGTVLGTPSYMAPEQARGEAQNVGPAADIYALGAMLYELLTGRPPFQAATVAETVLQVTRDEPLPPRRLQPQVPRDLETICLKCLQKDSQARYTSAQALADDLRRFLSDEPILARPVPRWERLARWCRRNPREAVLLGAVTVLLVLVALGSLAAAYRIAQEKGEADRQRDIAERNADGERIAREQADRNRNLAEKHADEARRARDEAGKQAQVALGTVYDVVTTADEKLRTKAEMGPLRKELLQLAMKRLDQVARDAATSGVADRTMGVALQRMGGFYEQMGMTDREVEVYRRSLDIFHRLMREQPKEDWNRFDAAISYDSLGEVGREIEKDPAKLFDNYTRALDLYKELVAAPQSGGPGSLRRRQALAGSYVKLGMLCLEMGDPARAAEYGTNAVKESRAAAALQAAKGDHSREWSDDARLWLAQSHRLLGRAVCRLGAEAQARQHYRECAALCQEAIHTDPLNALAKQELGRVEDALGDLEVEYGHLTAAARAYEEARAQFDALCQKDRGNPEFQWYRANADYHLGTARLLLVDAAAAMRHFQDCLKIRRRLQADDSGNIQRRIELMLVQARLHDHEAAARTAAEVCAYAPKHPGKLFSAACAYALCVPAARAAGPGGASQREYAAKALATLGQAIACGFKDRRALETSPDLQDVRGEDGYKAMLAGLASR
jgi:serine/threonine-protein kinase